MANASELLFSGAILGLVQGLTPGPLVTLVISETLKFGKAEGLKVAVSPLVTDSTIVLFAVFILSTLQGYGVILGIISVFGACYLIYLGLENIRMRTRALEVSIMKREAFTRGIITNFLNPHTYLFWLLVGGPIIIRNIEKNASTVPFFLFGFYCLLIGSEMSIALMIDKSKQFIKSTYYSRVIQLLGLILIIFAISILIDGLKLASVI
jgi:threonine/homoserine/homoserine lactone efflux protein